MVKEHHLEKEYRFPDFAAALAFVRCLNVLMAASGHPEIATTDHRLIAIAGERAAWNGRTPDSWEHVMPYGVRTTEQRRLAAHQQPGHRERQVGPAGQGEVEALGRHMGEVGQAAHRVDAVEGEVNIVDDEDEIATEPLVQRRGQRRYEGGQATGAARATDARQGVGDLGREIGHPQAQSSHQATDQRQRVLGQ